MKTIFIHLLMIGSLLGYQRFASTFEAPKVPINTVNFSRTEHPDPGLKQQAYEILKTKCNVCHKKQNPFKIFSLRNMDKHAPKIYKQVFVYERMPKGNKIKLTPEEYQTLKNWLKSKNAF